MGQLEVSGPGARDALARLLTNDIDAIGPGQGQYTLMCEDDGGVIDDLIAYALADRFLLVVNASNVAACRDRLADRLPAGVALADRSPRGGDAGPPGAGVDGRAAARTWRPRRPSRSTTSTSARTWSPACPASSPAPATPASPGWS